MAATALVAALVPAATVAGCSEDDARAGLDDARYELVRPEAWIWAPRERLDMGWEPPAGIEGLAGGGSTDPRDVDGDDIEPTDLDLENAARVHTDDTGGIWVLTYGTVVHLTDGYVNHIYDIGDGPQAVIAVAVDPDGRLTATNHTTIGTLEPGDDEYRLVRDRSNAVRANSLTYKADGTLLAGGLFDERLVVVDNEEERALLDLPDQPEPILGLIGFVTVLPDGRIAAASSDVDGGLTLGVVVERALRPIGGDTGQPRPPEDITSLAPAPDGRLLVTTPDSIEAVDVDTGESDTLVDLTGADGTPSAAATGDDLVFLADGRLWRLPDAFR